MLIFKNNSIDFLVILLFSLSGLTSGQITIAPLNAIVEIGSSVVFNCASTNTAPHWWLSVDGGSNDRYIAIFCVIQPGFEDIYSVQTPGGVTTCNLVVSGITLNEAGVYTCTETGPSANALLVVLDPMATVVVNNQSQVIENHILNITCTMTYAGSSQPATMLVPIPFWTNPNNDQIYTQTTDYDLNANTVTTVASVTPQRPVVPIFTCNVGWLLAPNVPPPGWATNIPPAGYSWSTSIEYDVASDEYTGCGLALHDASDDYPPIAFWDNMCYINYNDTDYVDTPCNELLDDLPYYGNAEGLINAGGNFGCLTLKSIPSSDYTNACHDNYQQKISLKDCVACVILFVCVRFP